MNPTLAIAQELVRRGEEVVYYLTEDFRATVTATGAIFHAYESAMKRQFQTNSQPSPATRTANPNFIPGFMPLMQAKESQQVLPQVLEPIRAEEADVILYDPMSLWARIVTQVLHIPAILICPTYVSNEQFRLSIGQSTATPSSLFGSLAEKFASIQAEIADLCAHYQIPIIKIRELFSHSEALNVVFLPRAFQPAGETFDERFVFVGPSLLPRQDAPKFPLDRLKDQPTLFISLGTGFNNRPDFYNLCFEAFGQQPWKVVLSHGRRIAASMLNPVPSNFLIAPYVPQLEVLQRTSVFITHGGMNSVMESLYYGVPMVLIPQMFEQEKTARRCAELGLGIALASNDLTAEILRAAVEQIHQTDTFRKKVLAMQREAHAAGGYQRAADVISHFAHNRQS